MPRKTKKFELVPLRGGRRVDLASEAYIEAFRTGEAGLVAAADKLLRAAHEHAGIRPHTDFRELRPDREALRFVHRPGWGKLD